MTVLTNNSSYCANECANKCPNACPRYSTLFTLFPRLIFPFILALPGTMQCSLRPWPNCSTEKLGSSNPCETINSINSNKKNQDLFLCNSHNSHLPLSPRELTSISVKWNGICRLHAKNQKLIVTGSTSFLSSIFPLGLRKVH